MQLYYSIIIQLYRNRALGAWAGGARFYTLSCKNIDFLNSIINFNNLLLSGINFNNLHLSVINFINSPHSCILLVFLA